MEKLSFLKYGFAKRRLTTTVYLIQLVLAITIGLQVYQVIDASIGHAITLEGLKLGNAHMVVNDLLNVHGASLSPLIGQVRWLILLYLILAAFIHAGIWYTIIHEEQKSNFWVGGATYFGRCLFIGFTFIIILILLTALIWLPFLVKFGYWMEHLPSEEPLIWGGACLIILWSIVAVFIFVASSFAKIALIRDDLTPLKSIFFGIKMSLRKSIKLFPMLLIVFLILIMLYSFHSFIDDWRILTSSIGILVLFSLQQIIVWVKIALRVSTYHYLLEKS